MTFDKSRLVVKKEVSISYDSLSGAWTRELNHNQTDLMIDVSEAGCVELSHLEAIVEEFKSLREELIEGGIVMENNRYVMDNESKVTPRIYASERANGSSVNPFITKAFFDKCRKKLKVKSKEVKSSNKGLDCSNLIWVHAIEKCGEGWFYGFGNVKDMVDFKPDNHTERWHEKEAYKVVKGVDSEGKMDNVLNEYWKHSAILLEGSLGELVAGGLIRE